MLYIKVGFAAQIYLFRPLPTPIYRTGMTIKNLTLDQPYLRAGTNILSTACAFLGDCLLGDCLFWWLNSTIVGFALLQIN